MTSILLNLSHHLTCSGSPSVWLTILCFFKAFLLCCSLTKSCLILCDPVDYSTPGSSVLHCLPKFVQIHAHRVGDAIQPSHPLPPAFLLGFCNPTLLVFLPPHGWLLLFSLASAGECPRPQSSFLFSVWFFFPELLNHLKVFDIVSFTCTKSYSYSMPLKILDKCHIPNNSNS